MNKETTVEDRTEFVDVVLTDLRYSTSREKSCKNLENFILALNEINMVQIWLNQSLFEDFILSSYYPMFSFWTGTRTCHALLTKRGGR